MCAVWKLPGFLFQRILLHPMIDFCARASFSWHLLYCKGSIIYALSTQHQFMLTHCKLCLKTVLDCCARLIRLFWMSNVCERHTKNRNEMIHYVRHLTNSGMQVPSSFYILFITLLITKDNRKRKKADRKHAVSNGKPQPFANRGHTITIILILSDVSFLLISQTVDFQNSLVSLA